VPSSGDIAVDGLLIRSHEHVVLVNGHVVELTAREFEIVQRLAEHPGWIYSAGQLSQEAEEGEFSPESVSVLVSRLRHKLAAAGAPDVVETVRGLGYRMAVKQTESPQTSERCSDKQLCDAWWLLEQAVIELDRVGDDLQRAAAIEALVESRRLLYAILSR